MGSKATEEALAGLEQLISHFGEMGKTVFIVLPSPTGNIFSPRRMIERSPTDFSFRVRVPYVSAPEYISTVSPIVDRLKAIAARTGAHLVDPIAALCDLERCPLMTADGLPIFRDRSHLNPTFVRDHVLYLDEIFMPGAARNR